MISVYHRQKLNSCYIFNVKTLVKPLANIGFFEREQVKGKTIANKCGRDFLYYSLNYLKPETYNPVFLNPVMIDGGKLFGTPMPAALAWTQLQFSNIGEFLKHECLELRINNKNVTSYGSFVTAILFSRCSYDRALDYVERAIDENRPVGIDISLGFGGLLDHVLFVYGYDEQNLYVCDTHQVPGLEYENADPQYPYYFKLPKDSIKKRWTRFGRVWELRQNEHSN